MANIMVDKVEIPPRDQSKRILHWVKVPEPGTWDENREGVLEEYYIIEEGADFSALIRVSSRSPFGLEQLDVSTLRGKKYRRRVKGYLPDSEEHLRRLLSGADS